mmetsp:Transcript_2705/g.4370  ORF Transcript_2705/g.4370 Transcript_2705/m.4370 type:complete len:333 (-) Transcript_2705:103-1101(-)
MYCDVFNQLHLISIQPIKQSSTQALTPSIINTIQYNAVVYNIKSQETRLVTLVPSDAWGGAGLLGVTIRLDNYGGADERLIRILTVEHNSPAAIAGLVSEQDYLLGTVSESLDDTQSLANLLMLSADQVVEFYVYNTNSDVVRVVPLMPTWSWGGKGLLGAEVGTGYLHRLPHAARGTSGTSIARKVRYVASTNAANGSHDNNGDNNNNNTNSDDNSPASGNSLLGGGLEHEPQLELEAEEGGHVTMASPDDVADRSNSTKNAINSGGLPAIAVAAVAVAAAVEETTEHEAMEEDGIIVESPPPHAEKRASGTAAELFAGPPPEEEEVVDLR